MSAPPLTGHQTAADALIDEALAKFFTHPHDIQRKPTVGGVNNVTMHLVCSTGERFVMRIYNNGNNSDKVAFEHAILSALAAKSLSFMVPFAIPSLAGRSHELLSSGAESCVFRLIEGQLASTTSPEEVGRAAGELSAAMGEIQIEQASPTAPYYDLFQVHHAIHGDRQLFYSALETGSTPFPAVDACRESIDELLIQIRSLEQRLITFHQWGLPSQIIHGDLHYDNVLVAGDAVTGLLDFEFCARDWRAMELAVALTKYVSEADPLPVITSFVRGFAQHGRLTQAECDAVPDLMTLRILSNVIYFTGRALAKEDGIESLTSRAAAYAKRVRWLAANGDAVRALIRTSVL